MTLAFITIAIAVILFGLYHYEKRITKRIMNIGIIAMIISIFRDENNTP